MVGFFHGQLESLAGVLEIDGGCFDHPFRARFSLTRNFTILSIS
jgi:hypothetical protein